MQHIPRTTYQPVRQWVCVTHLLLFRFLARLSHPWQFCLSGATALIHLVIHRVIH